MTRLLVIDLETTGLDTVKDRILTLALAVFDTAYNDSIFELVRYLDHTSYPDSCPEALACHHIDPAHTKEFGEDPSEFYLWLAKFIEKHGITHMLAHNGKAFDFPMLFNNVDAYCSQALSSYKKPELIDSMFDLPVQGKRLQYMAADLGFLNNWAHSAIGDVKTLVKIIQSYPMDQILSRAKSPEVTVRAVVSFDEREKAKKARFQWEPESKSWIKKVKACDLPELRNTLDFQIWEES